MSQDDLDILAKRDSEKKCHWQELHFNLLDTMSEISALKQ